VSNVGKEKSVTGRGFGGGAATASCIKKRQHGENLPTEAVAHCNAIAKKYEEIAKEYEALAKMHKETTKSAK